MPTVLPPFGLGLPGAVLDFRLVTAEKGDDTFDFRSSERVGARVAEVAWAAWGGRDGADAPASRPAATSVTCSEPGFGAGVKVGWLGAE